MSEIPLLKYDNMIALKSIEDNAKGDGNEDGEQGIDEQIIFLGGLLSWSELHRRVPGETGKGNRNVEQSNKYFLLFCQNHF